VGVAGGEARQGEEDDGGGGEGDEWACGGGVPSPETMASAHPDDTAGPPRLSCCVCASKQVKWRTLW